MASYEINVMYRSIDKFIKSNLTIFRNQLNKIIRKKGNKYDTIAFVSHNGAQGIGYIKTVCNPNKYYRYSFTWAYGPN